MQTGGRGGGALWGVLMAVMVVAGVVVPYGVLSGGPFAGWTFGFWIAFGLAVVAMVAVAVAGWRTGR